MIRILKNNVPKLILILILITLLASLAACEQNSTEPTATTNDLQDTTSENSEIVSSNPLVGNPEDEYYMFLFVSGVEFWKPCIAGFLDAGEDFGVTVEILGTPEYDVNEAITVFEQIVQKKPKGIAVAIINDEAFIDPINKAVEAGIAIVTFNADSPLSLRSSFIGPDNYAQGKQTADEMATLLNNEGKVAVLTVPGQSNHEALSAGYQDRITEEYPDMTCVEVGNSEADPTKAASVVSAWIQAYPDLKGIYCTDSNGTTGALAAVKEADKVGDINIITLDRSDETLTAIGEGSIQLSVCEGTYNEGFWSMHFLYQIANDLPASNVPPFVDCGTSIINKDNYKDFYLE